MDSRLLDYFDFEKTNTLLEGFNQATGFVTAILDLNGNVLFKSGWRQICTDFHRVNPDSAMNCTISDTKLANQSCGNKIFNYYKCINGLIDIQIPILIRNVHVANLFSGQIFFENPDINYFRKKAKLFGFDEDSYIEALRKVPVVSKEKTEVAMNFLQLILKIIIEVNDEKFEQIALNEDIKKKEKAIYENHIQLQQNINDLLESQRIAHVGTWRLDIETNQVVWSEELYKMYGFDPNLPPPPFTEHMKLFTPESWELLSTSIDQTRTKGISYELELKTIKKDGTNGWMWVRGEAGKDSNGNIVSLRGAVLDITTRKQTEEALHKSEERFRIAQEISPDGFTILQPVYNDSGEIVDFLFVYENQAIARLNKTNAKKVIGKRLLDLFPNHIGTSIYETYKYVAKTGKTQILEDINVGEVISKPTWLRLVVVSMGEDIAILAQDITIRKKNENELLYLSYHDHLTGLYNRRFFEEELKRLDKKENLPLSVIMCDVNGLKLVNDSFGHDSGDRLLIKTAKTIKNACRESDVVARIGGDEFVILLPKTPSKKCIEVANLIKDLASKENIENLELSISYGYDTKTTDKQTMIEIIANSENHMYRHKLYERSSMRSKTTDLIMNTLFEKSNREAAHSNRVSNICESIANKMNMDKEAINQMKIAGLIHDIGKIGIDEKILNKPGKLTIDEISDVERHPEIAWRILTSTIEFSKLAQFVLHHHEKWDGSGYPDGLKEEDIPLEARIIAIADAYDAMTSERSYRRSLSKEEAIRELLRCKGSQFDPNIVDVFVNEVL